MSGSRLFHETGAECEKQVKQFIAQYRTRFRSKVVSWKNSGNEENTCRILEYLEIFRIRDFKELIAVASAIREYDCPKQRVVVGALLLPRRCLVVKIAGVGRSTICLVCR